MSDGGALRELAAFFGFEFDHENLEKANRGIDGLKDKVKATVAVIAEAFGGIQLRNFVEEQVRAGSELEVMSHRLGLTTDQLQVYQVAAGESGVATESMTTGLRFLSRNLADAVSGSKEAAETFQGLKIALKENGQTRAVGDVLGDLADRMQAIPDPAKRVETAMKLLGRGGAELVPLLIRGRGAFDEARQSMEALGGGLSKDFVERAREAEIAQFRLNFALSGLKSEVANSLLPIFVELVDAFARGSAAVRAFFKDTYALHDLLEVLAAVSAYKALQSITALGKAFGLLKPSILETIAALWEFAAPIVIVGGLFILFQDFWTMMRGGESVIGDLLDSFFGLGTAQTVVADLNEAFGFLYGMLQDIGSILGDVATIIVQLVGGALDSVIGKFRAVQKALGDIASGNFGAAGKDLLGGGDDSALLNRARAVQAALKDAWGSAGGDRSHARGAIQDARRDDQFGSLRGPGAVVLGHIMAHPGAGPPSGHVRQAHGFVYGNGQHGGHAVHMQQTNHITVQTSSDQPRAVGEAVGQGVATPTERAAANALAATKTT